MWAKNYVDNLLTIYIIPGLDHERVRCSGQISRHSTHTRDL